MTILTDNQILDYTKGEKTYTREEQKVVLTVKTPPTNLCNCPVNCDKCVAQVDSDPAVMNADCVVQLDKPWSNPFITDATVTVQRSFPPKQDEIYIGDVPSSILDTPFWELPPSLEEAEFAKKACSSSLEPSWNDIPLSSESVIWQPKKPEVKSEQKYSSTWMVLRRIDERLAAYADIGNSAAVGTEIRTWIKALEWVKKLHEVEGC